MFKKIAVASASLAGVVASSSAVLAATPWDDLVTAADISGLQTVMIPIFAGVITLSLVVTGFVLIMRGTKQARKA